MPRNKNGVSRRNVLKVTGGATAGLAVTGFANAKPSDRVRVNIGYTGESGRRAALDAASVVHHDFSFDAVTLEVPKRAITALEQRSEVRYVEEDGTMHAYAQTLPWGVDRVDADAAHDSGYTGSGADIAIIDTGIDASHPDLDNNLGSGTSYVGSSWDDDNGHGTHCAGIAAAEDNGQGVVGVAPEATLHAVKVLNSNGSGSYSDIAAGVEYVANQGWDVGSMSLGGSSGSSALKDAVSYAYDNGVFLATAAGNSGPCSNCVGYPAVYSECVAISSTNDSDGLSYFSSTGPEVELAAPGSSIYSTYYGDSYDTLSGTSMACPHVAGAAGILMGQLGYSNTGARSRLNNTAENLGLSSNQQGNGLLDVYSAI
ncbi:peptidase S8/S53 subtilisin kexin sedolisin [Haladaptatus paucihalophilus DX253]|uniref:Subtilisin n=1 Tax=Haladaptatus paucihalophilus DX253 TaxID=797209 RepID=E7QYV0_HALPU|nr:MULTISPECIES: S8 family peptidase [Haladaptatus]EFW90366.1 peptidase S8/S53 subtilisin kexin sedolisin [Haladaptatus paucihalophilus DX253]GKZ13274.1 subtilisin E [Haladaptatus sp. T7]SHK02422.1 subtilisin [Haladaptatus paucihalophilus DX253]